MIVPTEAAAAVEVFWERQAYKSGWHDGRFGQTRVFTDNPRLSEWVDLDRLAYYYGHRDGRRIREILRNGK